MTENDKRFCAILAKNEIARECREAMRRDLPVNARYIVEMLKDIELFIGEDNQPNIEEIMCSSYRV